jgi:hypothetical protein
MIAARLAVRPAARCSHQPCGREGTRDSPGRVWRRSDDDCDSRGAAAPRRAGAAVSGSEQSQPEAACGLRAVVQRVALVPWKVPRHKFKLRDYDVW